MKIVTQLSLALIFFGGNTIPLLSCAPFCSTKEKKLSQPIVMATYSRPVKSAEGAAANKVTQSSQNLVIIAGFLVDSSGSINQKILLDGTLVNPFDAARQQLEAGATPNLMFPNNQRLMVGANYDFTKLLLDFGAFPAPEALEAAEKNHSLPSKERLKLKELLKTTQDNWGKIGRPRALLLKEERQKLKLGTSKK